MNLEQVAGGLVVAAVTGLGFLAVRYPRTFKSIYYAAFALAGLFLIIGITYDVSVIVGSSAILKFVAPDQKAAAEMAQSAMRIPGWVMWTIAASNFYFLFLDWLSGRLAAENQQKNG